MTTARPIYGMYLVLCRILNTTIRENILITRRDASREAVVSTARQIQIHDFIQSLPEGYDTYIGEGGRSLSGGERQHIALARVLLKDVPFLILDESTANLDVETEHAVMEMVLHIATGISLLIFTHRHIYPDRINRVYIMKQGRLLLYRP